LPAAPNVHHVAAIASALIERMSERADAQRASAAAEYLFRLAAPSFRATGIEPGLACRRGCDYCCRGYVSATAPQIFAAARAIRAGQSTHADAVARVVAAADRVRGLSWQERCRLHEPCPMLDAGECGIYAARPLACRGFVSYSAASCRQAFEDGAHPVMVPAAYASVRSALEAAMRAALKRLSFSYDSYEFDTALERVLSRPRAEADWLEGDDVFAGVDVDRSADPASVLQREIMLDTLIAMTEGESPEHLLAKRPD